jgi:hypothetical protein
MSLFATELNFGITALLLPRSILDVVESHLVVIRPPSIRKYGVAGNFFDEVRETLILIR